MLQDALTELKAPWALSVLMLSRQTLVPDSTDAISASMPRSRNERKCPAATPRGRLTPVVLVLIVNLKRVLLFQKTSACPIFYLSNFSFRVHASFCNQLCLQNLFCKIAQLEHGLFNRRRNLLWLYMAPLIFMNNN